MLTPTFTRLLICLITLGLITPTSGWAIQDGDRLEKRRKLENYTNQADCTSDEVRGCWDPNENACYSSCNDSGEEGIDVQEEEEESSSRGTSTPRHSYDVVETPDQSSSAHTGKPQESTSDPYVSDDAEALDPDQLREDYNECENLLAEKGVSCGSKTCMTFAHCAQGEDASAANCFAQASCSCTLEDEFDDIYTNNENATATENKLIGSLGAKPNPGKSHSSTNFYGVYTDAKEIMKNGGTGLPKDEWLYKTPNIPVNVIYDIVTGNGKMPTTKSSSLVQVSKDALGEWARSKAYGENFQECSDEMSDYYRMETSETVTDSLEE